MSTFTPISLYSLPSKADLVDAFVGKPLSSLRTPALIVDRTRFKKNSEVVARKAEERGMKFRAHVKTHKTAEGTRLQVEAHPNVRSTIASTLVEVWQIIASGVVADGLVDDILYSMPVSADKLEDLRDAQEKCGRKAVVRLMVDCAEQVKALEEFAVKEAEGGGGKVEWSVFVKVDGGGKRAGATPESQQLKDLINAILASKNVEIHGFYSHFGQSYASSSLSAGSSFFAGEIACVQAATTIARSVGASPPASKPWVLSVGATPTAHAAVLEAKQAHAGLDGELELHAGCYCMCDLQQLATTLTSPEQLALTVLARVVSVYPERGRGEAMCDAGALAVSKDQGPYPGFGRVVKPEKLSGWDLGRISQEHGTLVKREGVEVKEGEEVKIGDMVQIVPQHACLVCACFPWMYVVDDGGETVVDVWVPWKGW
ncbi:hypothetical protein IAT38_001732 [Cryptococcus sp. DSM 104549]